MWNYRLRPRMGGVSILPVEPQNLFLPGVSAALQAQAQAAGAPEEGAKGMSGVHQAPAEGSGGYRYEPAVRGLSLRHARRLQARKFGQKPVL